MKQLIHGGRVLTAGQLAGAHADILIEDDTILAILAPGSIDSDDMGFRLGALLLFGSAVGVVAGIGGRRHAVKMATRLF